MKKITNFEIGILTYFIIRSFPKTGQAMNSGGAIISSRTV